ncbi:MAG TPA: hypothetical protein VMW32_06940 [Bacteroidales bacterium]|nr:hypothetical protein [Bacteroidales bacterium]
MKKIFLVCLLLAFLFSCEKDKFENTCGVDNPLEDLAWLKEQIESIEQTNPERLKYYYIKMAEYEGQTVFLPWNCDPAANSIFIVLDCSGERIGIIGSGEDMISWDQLTGQQVIWKPENSACIFQ